MANMERFCDVWGRVLNYNRLSISNVVGPVLRFTAGREVGKRVHLGKDLANENGRV
jgi:hypothetical protein